MAPVSHAHPVRPGRLELFWWIVLLFICVGIGIFFSVTDASAAPHTHCDSATTAAPAGAGGNDAISGGHVQGRPAQPCA